MAISTNGTVLTRLAGALYNTQMSNATYAEVAALDPSALANTLYARDFSSATDATVATTLVTNLGLTAVEGLANWVAAQLTAAGANKGAKVVDLLNGFAQMSADATYGTAATAFNTKVDAALALSQTTGNTGGTFAAAGVEVVTGATFVLTTGVDVKTLAAGDDVFEAAIINGGTSTLNSGDRLVGGAGSDELSIEVTLDAVAGVDAVDAVAQVVTITAVAPSATTNDVTVHYGSLSTVIATSGADEDLHAVILTAAINALAGATVAVATDEVIVVTAPVAGTPLPSIGFSTFTNTADAPTIVYTTANVVAVDGVSLTSAVTVAAAGVSGVETVTVTNTGGAVTLDATTYSGVTNFVSNVSTGANTFNDIGTADLTVVGDDIVTNGAVSFRSSDTVSITDALILNVRGGVNAGAITSSDANDDWTSVTINSTGGTATATTAANVVGALDLGAGDKIQTVTINAEDSLTMTSLVGFDTATSGVANKATIVVTGDSQVTLGTLDAAVETLNASVSTGSIRFTASSQTDFQFVGGAGDDRVTTGAVLSTTVSAPGSINAGSGSADRLILADSTHVTTTVGAKYAGFEQLQVANGVTVDMDHLAANNSIDTIRLTTGGAVNDMTAAQALNVTVTTGGNNPTLTVKNGTTLGNVDTVKITTSDELATTGTIALGTPVLTGVEKLQLVATDNLTISALTGATSLDSITISGSKTVGITSGITLGNSNQLIDASAATGVQTINIAGATAAVRVLGGSAADLITTGAGLGDVINGGGGLDVITVTTATGTAYVDIQSDVIVHANTDHIDGFISTQDDFDYNGLLSNGTKTNASGIASTEICSATTIAGALELAGAGDDLVFLATTDLTGDSETALDAVEASTTVATLNAAVVALVANDLGSIAGLDAVLGADDFVLFQIDTNTASFVLRINNFNTTVSNTLTTDEITIVGVFDTATDLVAADYI
jgi:hypothetical protein